MKRRNGDNLIGSEQQQQQPDYGSSSSKRADKKSFWALTTTNRSKAISTNYCYCCRRRRVILLFLGVLMASYALFYVCLVLISTHPMTQEAFSSTTDATGTAITDTRFPAQCQKVVSRLDYCQKYQQQQSVQMVMVVFACHQTWCNHWGHCELCSGIGDRTRFLLSLVQDALDRCIPMQIDSPSTALAMRDDVVYHDPLGMLAEWFHYRSYNVKGHRVNLTEWIVTTPPKTTTTTDSVETSISTTTSTTIKKKSIFVHISPDNYQANEYDPCIFHALFRPSRMLQRTLDAYLATLHAKHNNNVIGIHFRSGDLPAFGLTDYKDARISSNLELALEKMMTCAQTLARRLFPTSIESLSDEQQQQQQQQPPAFLFVTDHRIAKNLVKRKYAAAASSSHYNNMTIYTTDIIPQNYRKREEDVHAWLEIWLLSNMKGLVMNVIPTQYRGTAAYTSYFAMLAAHIGFMNETQLMRCKLE